MILPFKKLGKKFGWFVVYRFLNYWRFTQNQSLVFFLISLVIVFPFGTVQHFGVLRTFFRNGGQISGFLVVTILYPPNSVTESVAKKFLSKSIIFLPKVILSFWRTVKNALQIDEKSDFDENELTHVLNVGFINGSYRPLWEIFSCFNFSNRETLSYNFQQKIRKISPSMSWWKDRKCNNFRWNCCSEQMSCDW